MMHAGTAAAATAGAGGATGLWLFGYNKDNFGFDAGMRFGRFMMSRGFANAQVGQYRQDIEGITGMTVSKMDAWQTVSTLFLAVSAALSCAGRIGMHGCAPPGWFCALFSGNIFLAVLFNGVSLWLSMHASLRAQCAATSLLTRKVRLPIPSLAQLDQARVFGSTFEKQETRDIFRVPFMRHPHAAPDMPVAQPEPEELAKMSRQEKARKAAHDPQLDFLTTNRDTIPSWLRDELVVDKGEGFPSGHAEPLHEDREAPEHFKLLMKAQEEWRDYDVYARISMLYGVVSFLYAVTYYTIGTAISELRGFWIMWSVPLVTMTAQALILRLDIMRTGRHYLPHWELIGSLAPYVAVAAASLEYRFYYSSYQVAITWVLVYLCFFCHLAMALRMLDLAWPDEAKSEDMPEEPGRQWWPRTWKVPAGFTKNLWFITPPKKLEASQHDLMHEIQDPTLASTMIYAVAMIPAVLAANTAEVSTSDVRHGAAFDNIKASWGKALNIGDFKTNVRCNYDYNDNRDFLKEVSVSGDLMEGSSSDDLQVSYDLTHNFKSKNTAVKVSAQTQGTTFAAEYDTDSNLKEVSARRDLDLGDQKVDLQPSWLVQAKTARVKMMSALGGSKDRFSAQVDYNVDGGATSYELGYSRNLEDGKEVSATFTPDNKQLEVEYVDSKFENGATWTATATVPMDDSSNVMDSSKLTLKRSWAW